MQMVVLILRWLLYAAELALALPVLYLVLLAVSALAATGRRQRQHQQGNKQHQQSSKQQRDAGEDGGDGLSADSIRIKLRQDERRRRVG